MRMNHLLIVITFLAAATLCLAYSGASSRLQPVNAVQNSFDQMIISRSKESWEAYKNKNAAAMKAIVTDDFASVTQIGPSNIQNDVATIDKLTIESYTIDDPKVTKVTKDVAILRYKCDLKGSFDGKPFGPVYATEVWVNRGGKWLQISYTETPVS